jgi:uncharacterized protein DUF4784
MWSNGAGEMVPCLLSQTADWLEPGAASLELILERTLLRKTGMSEPFEWREMQLQDQSRVALLQRQRLAILLP